jgi:hypothetical protein
MNKVGLGLGLSAIGASLLLVLVFLAFPQQVVAEKKVVEIKGVSYNVNSSLLDNLKSLKGKWVSVTTVSGKTFTGFVKEVGPHLVHVEKLAKREYFDALIRREDISAIETRFRQFQR